MGTKIAVVGLGYVGLPLALRSVECGYECIGIDSSPTRIANLSRGQSFTKDVKNEVLRRALASGFSVSDSPEVVAQCQVVVVCVPTPLDDQHEKPDLGPVLKAMSEVAKCMRTGTLVILESTVAPGTTEGPVLDLFLAQGLELDKDFFLAYSPERINPGSGSHDLHEIPKIVSGCSSESLRRAALFYEKLVDEVVTVAGTKEAEFAKLLENTYRLVNVSLVNELALAAHEMGIDFQEVTRAAATKPYGFHPFFASAGAGGHCIPVDPVYLADEISATTGFPTDVLTSAIAVNKSVPRRIIDEVLTADSPLEGKRVLVVGLAYKPGISDIRNAASLGVIDQLIDRGAIIEVYDPLVEELKIGLKTFRSIKLKENQNKFDFAVLLHPQDEEALQLIREISKKIYTTSSRFGEI